MSTPPSPAELNATIDQLLALRARHLVHRSLPSLLASIDSVVARFLDSTTRERREAEALLPAETGLSPEMIGHTLPLIFQEYRGDPLEELVDSELRAANRLDSFVALWDGQLKAYGPALIAHVLAGNLPGAGLDGIIFSLVVKSATLVKASSSAPSLPTVFARSLAGVDPELGACLGVVAWPGGNTVLEDLAFSRADVVLASGTDESLVAIRQRVRGHFIGYGHKVSLSVIAQEKLADAEELAQKAAYDVVLFDQRGCLSPQLVYVQASGAVTPQEFAALLAQALERWQHTLPRGEVPPEASIAIRRVRDEAEWQALAGKDVALYASPRGTGWTVVYESDPVFRPSPLYRTVRIKPFTTLAQIASLLEPWRSHLEAVGVAAGPEHLRQIADVLGQAGVSRVCPLGTMQTPPLGWRHGGRPRIADLVRWVGIET